MSLSRIHLKCSLLSGVCGPLLDQREEGGELETESPGPQGEQVVVEVAALGDDDAGGDPGQVTASD